jgi:toxin ParE1/3/4
VIARYLIRPKADQDLEDQAYYLANRGSAELGHRFLVAAHEAFVLLASQPKIGWHARLKDPELKALRIFSISGFEKMLVFYRPHREGIEIVRVVHGSRNLLSLLTREGME